MTQLRSLHQPHRPEWSCRFCGLPYPCPPARDRLVAVYGRTPALAERAAELLYEAVPDLVDVPLADLFERFIAWTAGSPVPGAGLAAGGRRPVAGRHPVIRRPQTWRRPGKPQSSR
jgi:hypothetical protein